MVGVRSWCGLMLMVMTVQRSNTEPWGTPERTGWLADEKPSTTTDWVLPKRNLIQSLVSPEIPYEIPYEAIVSNFIEGFAEVQNTNMMKHQSEFVVHISGD